MQKFSRSLFWTAALVGIVGVILRVLLFDVWKVPSEDPRVGVSIAPTLAGGDLVIVMHAGHPTFGELARCVDPRDPARFVVARVAADPGDDLTLSEGRVLINNKKMEFERGCTESKFTVKEPFSGREVEMACSMESLGTVLHKTGTKLAGGLMVPPIRTRIEPGTFYLVSDNRAYPFDSRDYGAVPVKSCMRIVARLWSAKGFSDAETRLELIK